MAAQWLILADDLTGAADCGIAFARAGRDAVVLWDGRADIEAGVVAFDSESRFLDPVAACARQVADLEACWRPGRRLYKKIDSTLRGHPAEELAALRARLAQLRGRPPMAVVAPAFPATGRTTRGGHVLVSGQPLETTGLWARDHSYATADLPAILSAVGLTVAAFDLDLVRSGGEALARALAQAHAAGIGAVVCDAAEESDLAAIAAASLPLGEEVIWVGAGGLAVALAGPPTRAPQLPAGGGGPILTVVGSVAEASRRQADALGGCARVVRVDVGGADLLAGATAPRWAVQQAQVVAAIAGGQDVLVLIAAEARPDLSRGVELADRLAEWLAPVLPSLGGVVMTGGDTARSLLTRLGASGIVLYDEVEPGVPIGVTSGRTCLPVISKAGGFGDDATLIRARDRLATLTPPPAAHRA